MYAKGMTTGDIEAHIQDVYGLSVSDTTVSRITDKILPVAKEWQQRPLESIYMNGFAALDIPPCRRYVVVKSTAGFAVCRLILKLLLFYSCLDFTQNLGETRTSVQQALIYPQNVFLQPCFGRVVFAIAVFSLNGGARLHRGPGQHGGPGAPCTGPSSVYWPLFSL